jgi:hypothetical protein
MTDTNTAATNAPENTEPSMQQKLVEVKLDSHNTALNVIIGFITLGQQRGVYTIQESAKIWDCIRMFQQPQVEQPESVEMDTSE